MIKILEFIFKGYLSATNVDILKGTKNSIMRMILNKLNIDVTISIRDRSSFIG